MCSYLPLELLNNDTRHLDKADIFALGATLYELATGCGLPANGRRYKELREGRLAMMPGVSMTVTRLVAVRCVACCALRGGLVRMCVRMWCGCMAGTAACGHRRPLARFSG